ncbi:MAG: D-glycerate dehydrogenase [Deltaproteobacteria bacterium]|nr:D-glycerate dehydrogenase [Deltaproteobacteria bacterium]
MKWITQGDGKNSVISVSSLSTNEWVDIFIKNNFTVTYPSEDHSIEESDFFEELEKGAFGVISMLSWKWDKAAIKKLSLAGVKILCNYAVGVNNIDLEAARMEGIQVGNTPDVLTQATAELAMTLTNACARKVTMGDSYVRNGKFHGWAPDLMLGMELQGKTLGIIGPGRIGTSFAVKMAAAYSMNCCYFARSEPHSLISEFKILNKWNELRGTTPLECKKSNSVIDLIKTCDVISIFVSLNKETNHLIGRDELSSMRKNSIIINVSRGQVINEKELVKHLQKRVDVTAGLDVYEREPVLENMLKELPNAVLLPHLGSATREARRNMEIITSLNIINFKKGFPQWTGNSIMPFITNQDLPYVPSILTF